MSEETFAEMHERTSDAREGRASRRRLLYVVNHAAFFVSHRLPIAVEALRQGFDVTLLTGHAASESMEAAGIAELARIGIPHVRVGFRASGMNPLIEARELIRMLVAIRRLRPDIIHCVSPKGILYGGILARVLRVPALMLSISGLGYAFTPGARGLLRRSVAAAIFRIAFKFVLRHRNRLVVVQNQADGDLMRRQFGVSDADLVFTRGSGVTLTPFAAMSFDEKQQMVLFPARLLRDKGAAEFVAAAHVLKPWFPRWRFVVAGATDYRNPSAVDDVTVTQWRRAQVVEFLGHQDDMLRWFRVACIVCLPSYREGLPKALLEAAAAGCAVVTTDVPGCREAVVEGATGDLVPARDSVALAESLRALMADPARRRAYGEEGRRLAAREFDVCTVVTKTINSYMALLARSGLTHGAK